MVTTADLPTAPSHPFYRRLNQSLRGRTTVHDLETLEIRTYISEPDRGRHWMRTLFGVGTPRSLQGRSRALGAMMTAL